MQRDVEVEFESTDKSGGFIGTMWVNKTENVAISLVREGLASVHAYSAEGLAWAGMLFDAEVCLFPVSFRGVSLNSCCRKKPRLLIRM